MELGRFFSHLFFGKPAYKGPSVRVFQNPTMERDRSRKHAPKKKEEVSSTISWKPRLFPGSLTKTFDGRPLSLHYCITIQKDSDDHVLSLTLERQRQTRKEHRERDPNRTTFSSTFNFNCQPHAFPNKDFEQCKDVCIGAERWKDFKDTYSNEYWRKNNQHTFGFFWAEGYIKVFFVPQPDYPKKNSPDLAVHTEEIIIGKINDYLTQTFNNKIPKGAIIVLYSPNSPCIKRKNNTKVPCMFQLLVVAKQWRIEYGIFTIVLFTKCWGPNGSNCFEDFKSIPDRFGEQKPFPIQLGRGQLKQTFEKKYRNEFFSMVHDKKDRNNLINEFTNVTKALESLVNENKSLTTQEHLDEGQKVIESCTYPEMREKVFDTWQEEVKGQEREGIVKEMIQILNSQIVKSIQQNLESILGEKSPIQLYQIPPIDEFESSSSIHLVKCFIIQGFSIFSKEIRKTGILLLYFLKRFLLSFT